MGILNPLPPLKAGETCTLSDEGHLKPSLRVMMPKLSVEKQNMVYSVNDNNNIKRHENKGSLQMSLVAQSASFAGF